jgi:hypothetical protein
MIENYRTGLIWNIMLRSPYVTIGLRRAGFRGGWCKSQPTSPGRNRLNLGLQTCYLEDWGCETGLSEKGSTGSNLFE